MPAPEGLLSTVSSEECNHIAELHPDRFVWSCCVDPRAFTNTNDADLGYALEHYVAKGAKSVGEVTANIYLDDPRAMNLFGYYHVLDGSTELYHRLHHRGIVFLVGGIVLAVIAAACFLIRTKS